MYPPANAVLESGCSDIRIRSLRSSVEKTCSRTVSLYLLMAGAEGDRNTPISHHMKNCVLKGSRCAVHDSIQLLPTHMA